MVPDFPKNSTENCKTAVIIDKSYPNQVFYFERGAYFDGYLSYAISKTLEGNNQYLFQGSHGNDFSGMQDVEFLITPEEVQTIIDSAKAILFWENNYQSEEEILDGYGFSIAVDWKNIKKAVEGYDLFPANHRKTVSSIQCAIEKLCSKHKVGSRELQNKVKRMGL